MNTLATLFFFAAAAALLFLPRRYAFAPLLVCACYMTLGPGIELGPFSFMVIRMIIATGFIRVVIRGERIAGGLNRMDRLFLAWGGWVVISSVGHVDPSSALIYHLGYAFNTLGVYFLMRVFCRSVEELVIVIKVVSLLLVPVAVSMLVESITGRNPFFLLGGVPEFSQVREGQIRAQGPFRHPILAGTVGAVCMPLVVALWKSHRGIALVGLSASLLMIYSCGSSGPILSVGAGLFGITMFRYRHRIKRPVLLGLIVYGVLEVVMKAPPYYLIARIDVVGGSTGWHRAHLIEMGFAHFNEWWFMGTDYTRHWMPTGVSWSEDHSDITNHYLALGVRGGALLMVLFIVILLEGFSFVGRCTKSAHASPGRIFTVWCLGAGLFTHAATCISVSYFDQSFVFLCLNLAVISSICAQENARRIWVGGRSWPDSHYAVKRSRA